MTYEIGLKYGTEGRLNQTVNEVNSVILQDGVYTICDVDGITLFSAPAESIIFIMKK